MNDKSGTGIFDFYTFQAILSKAGIFLPRAEVSKLYRSYDVDRNEKVVYYSFLRDLIGTLSPRRSAIVEKAFNVIANGSPTIPVATLVERANFSKLPRVVSGQSTEKEAFTEFFDSFANASPTKSLEITKQEWIDYYSDLSPAVADDETFAHIFSSVWGVNENPGASPTATAALKRSIAGVRELIADKIRQRSKAGGSESDTLRKTFKTFDLEDQGRLNEPLFFEALTSFGIYLDAKTKASFFASLDQCPDGTVDYTAFSHSVFGSEDGLLTSTHPVKKTPATTAAATTRSQTSSERKGDVSAPSSITNGSGSADDEEDDGFPSVLFLLGGPLSGKTEQAQKLVKSLGFVHINTQELLKQAWKGDGKGPSGNKYASIIGNAMESGAVVPADIVLAVIRDAMQASVVQGMMNFVIDGFPRSRAHMTAWSELMGKSVRPPLFILLDVPTEDLVARAEKKGCNDAAFAAKLSAFKKDTLPLCEWLAMNNHLQVVHAQEPSDKVHAHITQIVLDS